MKYTALLALVAVQANDFQTLLQLNTCNKSGVAGINCEPAQEMLFATGMNGDEDLGEDITMKGNKFHFNQEASLLQINKDYMTGAAPIPYPGQDQKEEKPKKDWNKGYAAPEQVLQMDPKIGKKATTFYWVDAILKFSNGL